MAHIANTRKVFNFAIEINGLNQFEVQTVELPEVTLEVTPHGDTNYDVGTPGRLKTGELKLEKIKPLPNTDSWAWDWFNAAQDPFSGGGALPLDVKRMIVVRELDPTGLIAVNSYEMEGCFLIGINPNKFDRMSSDNIIQTLTIHVDRMRQI